MAGAGALGPTSASGVLRALVTAPLALGRTWRMLREMNASMVNFHYPGQAPLGVALLKRLRPFRGKLVLSFYGTDVAPPRSRVEQQLQRFILNSADRLVANCAASRREWQAASVLRALADGAVESFGLQLACGVAAGVIAYPVALWLIWMLAGRPTGPEQNIFAFLLRERARDRLTSSP